MSGAPPPSAYYTVALLSCNSCSEHCSGHFCHYCDASKCTWTRSWFSLHYLLFLICWQLAHILVFLITFFSCSSLYLSHPIKFLCFSPLFLFPSPQPLFCGLIPSGSKVILQTKGYIILSQLCHYGWGQKETKPQSLGILSWLEGNELHSSYKITAMTIWWIPRWTESIPCGQTHEPDGLCLNLLWAKFIIWHFAPLPIPVLKTVHVL